MSDAPASTAHSETAGQTETSDDNYLAPGQVSHKPKTGLDEDQIEDLRVFLAEHFPQEVGRSNLQVVERPVDTAIRLLTGLHAHRANSVTVERCSTQYCNKPSSHRDAHGWVHYG